MAIRYTCIPFSFDIGRRHERGIQDRGRAANRDVSGNDGEGVDQK